MKEKYFEIQIDKVSDEISEILTAALIGIGYDSFSEEEGFYRAYIAGPVFDEEKLRTLLDSQFSGKGLKYEVRIMEVKNWNEEWEKNFEPVEIDGKCFIRAPFHESNPEIPLEIVIEPKMSFGTAHHETTWQMISRMMNINFSGMNVLDMGCGTAVLAILASKLGAETVYAIDNDRWAYENAKENVERNNIDNIHVILGDTESIPEVSFDIILANINRNILVEQIPYYAKALKAHGMLLVSGFYEDDLSSVTDIAEAEGLHFRNSDQKNRWVVAYFVK